MVKFSKVKNTVHTRESFPGQNDGEEVELVFHQHPIVMRKALIVGMLAILLGMMPLLAWTTPLLIENEWFYFLSIKFAWAVGFVVIAAWFYRWVGWYYSVYIITNERIVEIKQKGFFNRKVTEFGLDKVQNINYHIGGFQAVLFKYGDITAQTYVGDLVMKTIHKPVQIHEQIVEVVRKANFTPPPGSQAE